MIGIEALAHALSAAWITLSLVFIGGVVSLVAAVGKIRTDEATVQFELRKEAAAAMREWALDLSNPGMAEAAIEAIEAAVTRDPGSWFQVVRLYERSLETSVSAAREFEVLTDADPVPRRDISPEAIGARVPRRTERKLDQGHHRGTRRTMPGDATCQQAPRESAAGDENLAWANVWRLLQAVSRSLERLDQSAAPRFVESPRINFSHRLSLNPVGERNLSIRVPRDFAVSMEGLELPSTTVPFELTFSGDVSRVAPPRSIGPDAPLRIVLENGHLEWRDLEVPSGAELVCVLAPGCSVRIKSLSVLGKVEFLLSSRSTVRIESANVFGKVALLFGTANEPTDRATSAAIEVRELALGEGGELRVGGPSGDGAGYVSQPFVLRHCSVIIVAAASSRHGLAESRCVVQDVCLGEGSKLKISSVSEEFEIRSLSVADGAEGVLEPRSELIHVHGLGVGGPARSWRPRARDSGGDMEFVPTLGSRALSVITTMRRLRSDSGPCVELRIPAASVAAIRNAHVRDATILVRAGPGSEVGFEQYTGKPQTVWIRTSGMVNFDGTAFAPREKGHVLMLPRPPMESSGLNLTGFRGE